MLIGEAIDNVKAYCSGTWRGQAIREDTTRDRVLWGRTDCECRGIVTTCFASADVIAEAARQGANLVICHEALFWNHGDKTAWLCGNETFERKRKLLDEHAITVWRCHDYVHSGIPNGGRYVDGIYYALMAKLGWGEYLTGSPVEPKEFQIPPTTVAELTKFIVERLNLKGARVVGDLDAPVTRVLVPQHVLGEFDNSVITRVDGRNIDCLLSMEITDYTVSEYIRDSAQLGLPKGIIEIGHFNIEEPGMELMAEWLPDVIQGRVPVSFVPSGDAFNYIIS